MTFLLIDFKLDQKTQIRKYRWSEVPRIYAICVSIEHVHMHTYTYAHTHTHSLLAYIHAVVIRAWDRYVRQCTRARAYTCTRKSAFHADTVDCVARDAYKDVCIFTNVCVYVDSQGVRATRRRFHRRYWVAGGECSIFTLCLIAGYGVDYINLIPTRARRRALDSKRERFQGEGGPPRLTINERRVRTKRTVRYKYLTVFYR